MIEEFGLHRAALTASPLIVRGADTARPDLAPEAPGLLAASLGLSRMYADDLAQLDAGLALYDAFYRWCRDATEETHNWPAQADTGRPRRRRRERGGRSLGRRWPRRAHDAAHRSRRLLRRGVLGLAARGRAVLRRPGRADRGHAPHRRRREALDRRGPVPARAELLHAAAGPRGAAAGHLYRLADAPDRGGIVAGGLFVLPGLHLPSWR